MWIVRFLTEDDALLRDHCPITGSPSDPPELTTPEAAVSPSLKLLHHGHPLRMERVLDWTSFDRSQSRVRADDYLPAAPRPAINQNHPGFLRVLRFSLDRSRLKGLLNCSRRPERDEITEDLICVV